jgi:hypothetical protein
MSLRCWPALAVLVGAAGITAAEPPTIPRILDATPVTIEAAPSAERTSAPALIHEAAGCPHSCGPRYWASAEYLVWWMRGNPVPPLATLGDPADLIPGAIGQPGTVVLFDDALSYDAAHGGRASLGGWLGDARKWGWEVGGFLFENNSSSVNASSPAGLFADPALHVPVLDEVFGEEASIPLIFFGAESRLQLWGGEANLLYNWRRASTWSVDVLAGFRYLDLDERLTLNFAADLGFIGVQAGTDAFRTQNHFYAGQVGSKFSYRSERWSLDVIGKVAVGDNRRTLRVFGQTSIDGVPFADAAIFTGPNNIGRFADNEFAVAPEVTVQVGFDLRPNIRAFAGYNYLYMTNVARAGDSIDRVAFGSATRPGVIIGDSNFWAHGLNFGVQVRW